jgi:anti-sigma B factor antagonist
MASEILKKENYTLIRVNADRLDINTSPELKSELILLNNRGVKNIVMDMSKCNYCYSTGLRTILVGNRLCENAIGTYILFGLQPDVEHLIRISMLHTVLLITKTLEEAEELLKMKMNL